MTTILVRDYGINWTHYYEYQVEGDTARQTNSFRLHKFDENQGANNHPTASELTPAERRTGNVDIRKWDADGRPGGLDGLRANYRRPDMLLLNDRGYRIVY